MGMTNQNTKRGKRYNAYTRQKFRKKRFNKKGKKENPSVLLLKNPSVVPDQFVLKLVFPIKETAIASIASAPGINTYKGNSIHDVDLLNGVPLGTTDWENFYDDYMVLGSSIHLELIGNNNVVLQFAVIPNTDSLIGIGAMENIRSQPYASYYVCGLQGSNKHIQTCRRYMSTQKLYGVKDISTSSQNYQGKINFTDPSNLWSWQVYFKTIDNTTQTGHFTGEIVYYVKLYNRKKSLLINN